MRKRGYLREQAFYPCLLEPHTVSQKDLLHFLLFLFFEKKHPNRTHPINKMNENPTHELGNLGIHIDKRVKIHAGFPSSSDGKESACNEEDLGLRRSLEKEMASHSSILAWRNPRTEEPGGLQYKGSQRVGND